MWVGVTLRDVWRLLAWIDGAYPYAYIFCILYGTHGWSFCESACCEAVVALMWGGFVIVN